MVSRGTSLAERSGVLGRTLVVASVVAACGTDIQPLAPDSGNSFGAGGGAGLPCDVQAVLSNCTSCHGDPPNGAPMSLVTYGDLIASSPMGGSYAQRAYLRMTATTNPMPPAPAARVSASDIATYKAWLDAGMPAGTCGADPLNAAPVCTSNSYWRGGDEGSSRMHPGDACISCHRSSGGEAPYFTIAGTVYPTGHEPDDCNGTTAAQVVITDKNGTTLTLTPNSAGNFRSSATVAFPITAKVVSGGRERAMQTPQMSGDCNSCHTQMGTMMAPGRVTLP